MEDNIEYDMEDEYDFTYILEVPFPFAVLETGEFLVGHYIECQNCKSKYPAYINMTKVHEDKVLEAECIQCGKQGLEIITYNLKPLD